MSEKRRVNFQNFEDAVGDRTRLIAFEIIPPLVIQSPHFLAEAAKRQRMRDKAQGAKIPFDPLIPEITITHSDAEATYGILEFYDTKSIGTDDKTRIVKETFQEGIEPLYKLGETALIIAFDYPHNLN